MVLDLLVCGELTQRVTGEISTSLKFLTLIRQMFLIRLCQERRSRIQSVLSSRTTPICPKPILNEVAAPPRRIGQRTATSPERNTPEVAHEGSTPIGATRRERRRRRRCVPRIAASPERHTPEVRARAAENRRLPRASHARGAHTSGRRRIVAKSKDLQRQQRCTQRAFERWPRTQRATSIDSDGRTHSAR